MLPEPSFLEIDFQKLSLPTNCENPEIIPVIYLIPRNINLEQTRIFDIMCENYSCPIKDCQYHEITKYE